ncbi:MAG: transcriptional repressor, partial [Actinobacteria bacterium]|nr:transcriptional repressor [Actinomycetota bacterium]
TADNHHHVQCIVCHRIEDVDCVVGEAPCLTPHDAHGMRVLEASVTFRGVCAACDGDPSTSPTHPQRKDQHV